MDDLTRVAQEIKNAKQGHKTVTIHYQALQNAQALEGADLALFCREARISQSYATEIRKMIALRKFMNEIGMKIAS